MRRHAVVVLAAVALLGGYLLWNRGPQAARSPQGEARPPIAEGIVPVDAEAANGTEDVATLEIAGRVVVVEEDGRLLARESGTIYLWTDADDLVGEPVVVAFTGGKWRATVPAKWTTLRFGYVWIGDRRAVADPATAKVPEDGILEVRCWWFVPARLRVIGEKSEDLEDVELVEDRAPRGEIVPGTEVMPDADGEGEEFRRIRLGPSPVELPGEAGTQTYWVRARDHAWSRITIAQGFGGERLVRLPPAGTLEVRLVPIDFDIVVRLNLYRLDEEVLGWRPDGTGLSRIEGLPPGRLEIRASLGEWWQEGEVITKADVEIEPGRTREISLSLRDVPPQPDPVPLEGTLVVGAGWPEPEEPAGFCWTRGEWITMDGGFGPLVEFGSDGRWSAGLVEPGRHFLTVEPWRWVQAVDVGPRGTTEARLVVPPPCDVEVRLVDAVTGDVIADENEIYWCVKSEQGIPALLCNVEAQACMRRGIYRFQAPPGTLVVWLWSDLVDAPSFEVELKAGLNRVDLKGKGIPAASGSRSQGGTASPSPP